MPMSDLSFFIPNFLHQATYFIIKDFSLPIVVSDSRFRIPGLIAACFLGFDISVIPYVLDAEKCQSGAGIFWKIPTHTVQNLPSHKIL